MKSKKGHTIKYSMSKGKLAEKASLALPTCLLFELVAGGCHAAAADAATLHSRGTGKHVPQLAEVVNCDYRTCTGVQEWAIDNGVQWI